MPDSIDIYRLGNLLSNAGLNVKNAIKGSYTRLQQSEIKKSLEKDVELAIKEAKNPKDIELLKKARDQYKTDSQALDDFNNSFLFKHIDKQALDEAKVVPEKIASMLEKMPPSQLKMTMKFLKQSPQYSEIETNIKNYYWNKAYNAATENGVRELSPLAFIKAFPDKEIRNIIFNTREQREVASFFDMMDKVSRRQVTRHGAQTAQRLSAADHEGKKLMLGEHKASFGIEVYHWLKKHTLNKARTSIFKDEAKKMTNKTERDAFLKNLKLNDQEIKSTLSSVFPDVGKELLIAVAEGLGKQKQ